MRARRVPEAQRRRRGMVRRQPGDDYRNSVSTPQTWTHLVIRTLLLIPPPMSGTVILRYLLVVRIRRCSRHASMRASSMGMGMSVDMGEEARLSWLKSAYRICCKSLCGPPGRNGAV
jgi:hypothetical protein